MKLRLLGGLFGAIVLAFLFSPSPTFAIDSPLPTAAEAGVPTFFSTVQGALGRVFQLVFAIAGAIFVILLVVGGVMYLTAAGNEENTTKARRLMIDAIVGLIITLSAFAIGNYVLGSLTGKFTPTTGVSTPRLPSPAPTPPASPTQAEKDSAYRNGVSAGQQTKSEGIQCDNSSPYYASGSATIANNSILLSQFDQGFRDGCK